MPKEILKISTVEETRNFRKFNCKVCGKKVKESKGLDSFTTKGREVNVEFQDYCNKCGKKEIKNQRKVNVLFIALQIGKITQEDLKNWKDKKISQKEFWSKVNQSKGDTKKRNAIILRKLLKVGVSPSNLKRKEKRKALLDTLNLPILYDKDFAKLQEKIKNV